MKSGRRDDYDSGEPIPMRKKKKTDMTDEERERILEMVDNEPEVKKIVVLLIINNQSNMKPI